jgi:hypothetical protein
MTAGEWTPGQLAEFADAEELVLVISRPDRTDLRLPVWLVVVDGDLYVRSYKGVTSGWYRGVEADQHQRIVLGGHDTRVLFEFVPRTDTVNHAIGATYLAKYSRFNYRDAMVEPAAVDATLRILPED